MTSSSEGANALVTYGDNVVGVVQLNNTIELAWAGILKDPRARAEAAEILAVAPEDLEKLLPTAPVQVDSAESGFGPLETAIIVFVSAVAYDVAKDFAKTAVKAALLTLWEKAIRPRVENMLPLGSLGNEVRSEGTKDKKA